MKKMLKIFCLGMAISAAAGAAQAQTYSFTINDQYANDVYYGSSLTGTVNFVGTTPTQSYSEFTDDTGLWTFTVTAATGNAAITALVGDVFKDNDTPSYSYVYYYLGGVFNNTTSAIGLYYFGDTTQQNGAYIYNDGNAPEIDFYNGNTLLSALYSKDASGIEVNPTLNLVVNTPVPEPASLAVLLSGVAGVMGIRRRRRG